MNAKLLVFRSALMIISGSQLAGAQEYSIVRLEPPSTNLTNYSSGVGINNQGVVIGSGSAQFTTDVICIWQPGQITGSPRFFYNNNNTTPEGINDAGDFVGNGRVFNNEPHGFLNSTDLGKGYTNDINNKGQVVGWTFDSLYLYKDGVFDYLPTAFWGSEALSINDSGVAVGYWYTDCATDCYSEVCLFRNDSLILLGTPSGSIYAEGNDINNSGLIAGWSCVDVGCTDWRGFLWDNGTWIPVPTLGGVGSRLHAVNDLGVAVGDAYDGGGAQRAIVFDTVDGVRDLNTLIPSGTGWNLVSANDINKRGQIVGFGTHGGLTRAFLLTPPLTLVLRDIHGDLVRNASVTVSRLRNDPPLFSAYWTEAATSDDNGEIKGLNNSLFPGDTFMVSMIVHSEPAVKHTTLLGTMYTIYLDNMVIGSDSKAGFAIIGDGTQEVIMQHTTVAWNMVISIEWDARTDYWTTLQSGLRAMANYQYDVSDGQVRFDTIRIYTNRANWDDADVQIHASNIEWPRTWSDSIRGLGGPILMPRKWYGNQNACRAGSFVENPLNLNDSINYTTFCHEWGHYAMGFGDEYNFLGRSRCGSVPNYGYMDSQYPFPWNGPYRSEMSTADRYVSGDCQNNDHWTSRRMSCWDWFRQSFQRTYRYDLDSVYVPIKRPQDRNLPPGQDYLSGPNDVLTVPNYDVGSAVVFPNAPPLPVTSTNAITLTDVFTGAKLGNVNVQLKVSNAGLTINQGNTTDSGSIQLLGSTLADTVVAAGNVTYGASTLGASWSPPVEQWYSYVERLISIALDGGVAELVPVSGSYRFLFQPAWNGDTAGLRIVAAQALDSLPQVGLRAGSLDSMYSLSWDGSAYFTSLGTMGPIEGSMTLLAFDDLANSFFVPNDFGRYRLDTGATPQSVRGPGGNSQLFLAGANPSVRSALIVHSSFPVIRDGLPVEAIQAGSAVGLAFEGTDFVVGDNVLTIRYDDALLNSVDPSLESSLHLWAWDESLAQWVDAGGTADTAHDEVSGRITGSGVFAAFTTAVTVGVGHGPDGTLPTGFELRQNYPNPFNPVTTIEYSVATRMRVTIEVFNVLGQRVGTLVNETQPPGSYQVDWDGIDDHGIPVASGIYLYRLRAGERTQTKKMLLVR